MNAYCCHPAQEISRMLAERISTLAPELLPHGHREGAEWVARSIEGTSARSLSIRLTGAKAGVWADFADPGKKGDALDLAAHVLFHGDKKAAYAWSLKWLGLAAGTAPLPARPAPIATDSATEHDRASSASALRLFLSGGEALAGTPAAHYLAARGIDLALLGRQPRSLRYHPACLCTEAGAPLPALLAAICGPDGRHIATHRTWIAEQGGTWRKAPLCSPKKVLGSYTGGTIRLWRGASGKPLNAAPETDTVVIGEGIETCLSVAMACPEYRILAAVSLGNLGRIILPVNLIDVIIAADNDQGKAPAEAALQRAANRLLAEGRSVRIARSSAGKDFNDGLNS